MKNKILLIMHVGVLLHKIDALLDAWDKLPAEVRGREDHYRIWQSVLEIKHQKDLIDSTFAVKFP